MALPVLICDDSGFARKQLARSLPQDWDVDVSFAANGAEAIVAIEEGRSELLFLDLNMPVMDGYQVLEAIRSRDLPTLVIVVSGDVQEQARQRVKELGALDFITKPVNHDTVETLLAQYGILDELKGGSHAALDVQYEASEGYQEIANVSMGRAAAMLAKVLGVFVDLPIPRVERVAKRDVPSRAAELAKNNASSVVSQGFVGSGIAGEALLLFSDAQFENVAQMLEHDHQLTPEIEMDLLMDVSNILIGACLSGFCEQLDLTFSVGHPFVLSRGAHLAEQRLFDSESDEQLLAIEIHYGIKDYGMNFHLLVLFTEESVPLLDDRIALLLEQ